MAPTRQLSINTHHPVSVWTHGSTHPATYEVGRRNDNIDASMRKTLRELGGTQESASSMKGSQISKKHEKGIERDLSLPGIGAWADGKERSRRRRDGRHGCN